jgi:hypothetical protein
MRGGRLRVAAAATRLARGAGARVRDSPSGDALQWSFWRSIAK